MIQVISAGRLLLPALSIGLTTVLAASCGLGDRADENPAQPAGTGHNPIAITTAVAEERDVPLSVDVPGSFVADEASDVASEGTGLVVTTPVDIGDRVSRGAVLARLDDRDARLRLEQARAALQQAEASLGTARERQKLADTTAARYEGLIKTGDISRALYDQLTSEAETARQAVRTAEAAVADANSRVALAEKALADSVIAAPFEGFVTARSVTAGEYVGPGTRVATVMRLDPIKLRMQVPESSAAQVRLGQTVSARVEALGNETVSGKVTAVNAALDPSTRAVIVEATMPNPRGTVRAQMFAAARIELGRTEPGVFVPKAALLPDPNTNSYQSYVIEKGFARLRVLQIADDTGTQVRIRSGIRAGETVATSALDRLFDGARVTAETAPASPAAEAR